LAELVLAASAQPHPVDLIGFKNTGDSDHGWITIGSITPANPSLHPYSQSTHQPLLQPKEKWPRLRGHPSYIFLSIGFFMW
jgi:hypothetical protein